MTRKDTEVAPQMKKKLEELVEGLDKFRKKLEKLNYTYRQEKFLLTMKEFHEFLSAFDDEELIDLFKHSEYWAKYRPVFSSAEQYYTRAVETMEAINIAKSAVGYEIFSNYFDANWAKEGFKQMVSEIKALDFKNAKTLVMVGCGPMPESIFYIYENTDIEEVVGLDNNQESVFMAGELVRAIKKTPRIKISHQDGMHYDYKNADLVLTANFITPKKRVLQRIAETAKPGVQILVRDPILLGQMLYEDSTNKWPERLMKVDEGAPSKYFLYKFTVLTKPNI